MRLTVIQRGPRVGRRNFQTPWTIDSLFRIVGPVDLGAPTSVPNTSTPGRVVEAVPSSRTWEANRQISTTNGYLEGLRLWRALQRTARRTDSESRMGSTEERTNRNQLKTLQHVIATKGESTSKASLYFKRYLFAKEIRQATKCTASSFILRSRGEGLLALTVSLPVIGPRQTTLPVAYPAFSWVVHDK